MEVMPLKIRMEDHCWRLLAFLGDHLGRPEVVPCCFDKDATHKLGDLKSSNFKTLGIMKVM